MPPLRAQLRLARLLAASVGWITIWALAALATACAPATRLRLRGWAFASWGRAVLRALGLRLEVRGRPPHGPFLLVTNHSSYADIPVLASVANGWFVAKAEIARWPLMGLLARGVGTIFLERGPHRSLVEVSRAVEQRLARGYAVFLFPEGGIPPGPGVGEFRGPLLEPAVRGELPVHWAAIRYATGPGERSGSEAIEWRRGEPLLSHVLRFLSLKGARAILCFGEHPLRGVDRKELARELERRVRELHEKAEIEGDSPDLRGRAAARNPFPPGTR